MKINAIYSTFNGEQNPFGIGSPTIFLRTAGCHIRCYAKTLGILCDTPEALEKDSGDDMTTEQIIVELNKLRTKMGGASRVCLTGGDPLWRKPEQLHELFRALGEEYYQVTVETSGTLDWTPFYIYPHVHWIVDWKLASAGVGSGVVEKCLPMMTGMDYIKFVIYDETDYLEFKDIFKRLLTKEYIRSVNIAVGPYWGGKIDAFQLFYKLEEDGLIHEKVHVNFQAHKALYPDYDKLQPARI